MAFVCLIAGCVTSNSTVQQDIPVGHAANLTPGATKAYIYPGRTTQAEMTEIFGPPDLMTRKEGKDVWTYERFSYQASRSDGFLTIFIAGKSTSQQSVSSRSVMLIVYFDENDIVADYRLSSSRF